MAGPRGFEPRIPGFLCRNSEGLHDLPCLCVLILARLRARLSLEAYLLKYTLHPTGTCQLESAAGNIVLARCFSGDSQELAFVGHFCFRTLRVRKNLMWESFAVVVVGGIHPRSTLTLLAC